MPNILLSGLNYGPKFNSIEHKNKNKKNLKKIKVVTNILWEEI